MANGARARLEAIGRKTVTVKVEGDEEGFTVQEINGTTRDKFQIAAFKAAKDGNREVDIMYLQARLVAFCLIENGARLYSDGEVELLNDTLSASVIQTLFNAAQKLNKLDGDAVKAAAKNSESGPTAASPSA